jgi:hypothetical protein
VERLGMETGETADLIGRGAREGTTGRAVKITGFSVHGFGSYTVLGGIFKKRKKNTIQKSTRYIETS